MSAAIFVRIVSPQAAGSGVSEMKVSFIPKFFIELLVLENFLIFRLSYVELY
jgi:hypothetical protein